MPEITAKIEVGCGHLYISIGINEDGKPIEIFARLGKAGGCEYCHNAALGTAISIGLQYGVPIEEFSRELIGFQCPRQVNFPKDNRVLSCPDAIAKVIKRFVDENKEITSGLRWNHQE